MKYRINYPKVISQANSISEEAEQLSAQIKMLAQLELEGRNVWKGEAADVFFRKLDMLRSEMDKTKAQMFRLASTVIFCADRIQREDQKAQERAAALKTGH